MYWLPSVYVLQKVPLTSNEFLICKLPLIRINLPETLIFLKKNKLELEKEEFKLLMVKKNNQIPRLTNDRIFMHEFHGFLFKWFYF